MYWCMVSTKILRKLWGIIMHIVGCNLKFYIIFWISNERIKFWMFKYHLCMYLKIPKYFSAATLETERSSNVFCIWSSSKINNQHNEWADKIEQISQICRKQMGYRKFLHINAVTYSFWTYFFPCKETDFWKNRPILTFFCCPS